MWTSSYVEDRNGDGSAEKYYNPPEMINIINTWGIQYSLGYSVIQIPKSPYYNSSNTAKHFEYDLLYSDDAVIDDDIDN